MCCRYYKKDPAGCYSFFGAINLFLENLPNVITAIGSVHINGCRSGKPWVDWLIDAPPLLGVGRKSIHFGRPRP